MHRRVRRCLLARGRDATVADALTHAQAEHCGGRAVVGGVSAGAGADAVGEAAAESEKSGTKRALGSEPVASASGGSAGGGGEEAERGEGDVGVVAREEAAEVLRGVVHVPVGAVVEDDVGGLEDPEARLQGEGLALVGRECEELQVLATLDVRVEEVVEVVHHGDPVLEVTLRSGRGRRVGAAGVRKKSAVGGVDLGRRAREAARGSRIVEARRTFPNVHAKGGNRPSCKLGVATISSTLSFTLPGCRLKLGEGCEI